jgi:hypothetical protein
VLLPIAGHVVLDILGSSFDMGHGTRNENTRTQPFEVLFMSKARH